MKEAIKKTLQVEKSENLDEAYVAEPKAYKQVSDLVSEKTKELHTELYKKHVTSLNKVSAKLDSVDKSSANSNYSEYRSLKLDETSNLNSVWLHELYFANCFDPHSEIVMDSIAYIKLQKDFGTFEDWQHDFIACGLSAGNGWVVCGYNMFLKRYVNTFISDDANSTMLGLYPIIVVDMHEHAYIKDYLINSKNYLMAQMREFNWEIIEERIKKSETIASAVK